MFFARGGEKRGESQDLSAEWATESIWDSRGHDSVDSLWVSDVLGSEVSGDNVSGSGGGSLSTIDGSVSNDDVIIEWEGTLNLI